MPKYKTAEEVTHKELGKDFDNWIFYCRATKNCDGYAHAKVPIKKLEFIDLKCPICKKCFTHYFIKGGLPLE